MRKLLIANRGEIARRIIRTAHRMGIETVAVYSEADADAPHVHEAGQAVLIGPAPASESYLLADRLLDAAARTNADAVHPGYGFLSENAGFALAVRDAGLTFVGPPVKAIDAMGLKDTAKKLMKTAGVPVTPGYQGDDQSLARLEAASKAVGYPLLIKAVAGGGGKGMRRVDDPSEFADALIAAKREGEKSFGNDGVMIEKLILRPRHVEVQVFADRHGNAVHLFERDCSLQRRHQKVIEEAPAPGLSASLRKALGAAAVKAATAIGYEGAGTIEFILDCDDVDTTGDPKFYFMEMNTRLQVEHPVTELITGTDLVEWQIRVARGEKLPLTQEQLRIEGHAVEARLYAEDPESGFLPSTGRLRQLVFPEGRPGVRIDSGVVEGGEIGIHYDPMIAKVIAHGADRQSAIDRLVGALDATIVEGVRTNRAFLARLVDHPSFRDGDVDTGFIARHAESLKPPTDIPDRVLALAALSRVGGYAPPAAQTMFERAGAWRMNLPSRRHVDLFPEGGEKRTLSLTPEGAGYRIEGLDDAVTGALAWTGPQSVEADLGDELVRATIVERDSSFELRIGGRVFVLGTAAADADAAEGGSGRIAAPMPGRVLAVFVKPGDRVEAGARLLVLEAMKMENRMTAPVSGTVAKVGVAEGDQVAEGTLLVEIESEDQ
ncbi:acetyl/propionyl/methylcrotonyl-CoA carboxylase subunit alpha [Sphingosinicella microcystinivorans]|uniref:acetyl/propionyl/methylcrotonyl-CoA carboxylase subunit alpha n=1 Tax=Sphingosinicella microcystinivorans TaxID=335406 RepID=UPI0022F3ED63|nr:acetyl/propionyl/methylcrotonyl-CoA carboxylase subunit alpha [Sphingosinicella microcystinivorans]WBX83282.1 acetyl/propionyl/methylcrotonyl-CoA carboxylase subunit alpha [Sphingosinicella microcystinivorans]